MPTPDQWLETTTRARALGYRVLIVAASHVELIDAGTGRTVATVRAWGEVGAWLDEAERMMSRKRAA